MKWQPKENQTFCYLLFILYASFFLSLFSSSILRLLFKIRFTRIFVRIFTSATTFRGPFIVLVRLWRETSGLDFLQRIYNFSFTSLCKFRTKIAGSVAENRPRSSNLIAEFHLRGCQVALSDGRPFSDFLRELRGPSA